MEEAARYLEAYKALENKPPDNLMVEPAAQTDHIAQVTDFLTSVRRITKADAVSALRKFDVSVNIFLVCIVCVETIICGQPSSDLENVHITGL